MESTLNNMIELCGMVETPLKFNHEAYGEKFYMFFMKIMRTSGTADILPVMISERVPGFSEIQSHTCIDIIGQFRSYSTRIEDKNKVSLYAFVQEIRGFYSETDDEFHYKNQAILSGYICKKPVYRGTPLGRKISDFILAVHRSNSKSDYIPCISWGRNAMYSTNLDVGEEIAVYGRVQSRDYTKKLSDGSSELRTAYEVSIERYEVIYSENQN